ncbi:Glutamate--tRNA ligase mitochondrial [Recurvomyces mirabilis]|uniref:Glutamate--tRNA ligase mitochondrial n=1 Tax=Recurvomyces mirabilis TaxID=574656 RepID=A0AAE0WXR3_9PEZI|nr:Glutamate--tRNA ligase mitochondrial [Recurvomyces mirabilis]KAK5162011.1 Glutamate--tRNA ligase mitochondrial [Recurvomyces mirabilis]
MGAEKRLIEDLQWAGLHWDEGPGVGRSNQSYRQSERNDIYRKHAQGLLATGAAYRCFCTPQASGQGKAAHVTSGCYQDCSSLSQEHSLSKVNDKQQASTIRLKRAIDVKDRIYPDLVHGKIKPLKRKFTDVASEDGEAGIDAADTVLMKSDGTPTYHFANVVDDHLMEITHVIRGAEWMASTPLHYDLYSAFGWQPPHFAHVGLLLDQNKAKLSKRNGNLALDVRSMREQHGVLPETLVNFLALLGWSNPWRNDVYDLDGLAKNFDLKFTKGNSIVNLDKLWYLQKQHVAQKSQRAKQTGDLEPIHPLVDAIANEVRERWPALSNSDRFEDDEELWKFCSDVLLADSKSYQNAKHFVDGHRYLFAYNEEEVPIMPDVLEVKGGGELRKVEKRALQLIAQEVLQHDIKTLGSLSFQPVVIKVLLESLDARDRDSIDYADIPDSPEMIEDGHFIALCKSLVPGIEKRLTESEFQGLALDKRAYQAAFTKYLRNQLSYGLSGPSIGSVMALLGYEECSRRLGVTS